MPKQPKVYLFDHSPHLRGEWDYERNNTDPSTVRYGVATRYWWICAEGHSWENSPNRRTNGRGCPYCTNRLVHIGYNDLATTHPELVKELCPEGVHERPLTKGSSKKVWWICEKGHRYSCTVYNRVGGKGCNVCANKVIVGGINDLATTHPDLAGQLVDPSMGTTLSAGSGVKAEWACRLGHTWSAVVCSRTGTNGNGCPICAGKLILTGYNDLSTTHPYIAAEYVGTAVPVEKLSMGSHNVADWKCTQGHVWRAAVYNRVAGNGCPRCSLNHTSKREEALRDAIGAVYPLLCKEGAFRVPLKCRGRMGIWVDVHLESPEKTVVEYDGSYFHSSGKATERDVDQTTTLLENGYTIIRVREQIPQIALPLLPLDNPNLLQLSVPYSKDNENIIEAVDQIKQWLESKND